MSTKTHEPNPRKVRAGRLNQLKWKGFTPEGVQRLRETALRNKPWQYSTGPRTPEGKARSGMNGRHLPAGAISKADVERKLAEVNQLLKGMAACRALVSGGA